jgi:hypothetical protein
MGFSIAFILLGELGVWPAGLQQLLVHADLDDP